MKYKQRPGIVLTKICNYNVLIPARSAYPECTKVRQLPFIWAATWNLLSKDNPEEDIMQVHRILTKRSDEEIRERLERFYKEMYEAGFLIQADDSAPNKQADS